MKHKNKHYPKGENKEVIFNIGDAGVAQTLMGERDSNLRVIENELGVSVRRNMRGVAISGQDAEVDLAYDLLQQLQGIVARGEPIFAGDVERAIKMLSGDRRLKLEDLFRDQITVAGKRHSIVPKTPRQKVYLDAIRETDLVFGVGPAGTGKTYLAMAMAVTALLKKQVRRVVLCRPAVEAGEKLGFLPGDMAEKVNPYLRPLYDALHDFVDHDRAKEMIERGQIEVAPLAFMRGRTLSEAFVILDEAQNTTPVQMKMFLTRLGEGAKGVVTGDITQIDLPRGVISGLTDALRVLKDVDDISFVYFSDEDVIRHRLVSKIVAAYKRRQKTET